MLANLQHLLQPLLILVLLSSALHPRLSLLLQQVTVDPTF